MCRYAMTNYKPHFACFNCRKSFKRRLLSDIQSKDEFETKEAKCPECSGLMADMGRDFEAPKKSDTKAWEHIKLLYSVGITFHSCGCYGPGYIPNTTERLIAYYDELKTNFQSHLAFWRQRIEPVTKSEIDRDKSKNWNFIAKIRNEKGANKVVITNEEAKTYWIKKIKEIDEKLRLLTNTNTTSAKNFQQ